MKFAAVVILYYPDKSAMVNIDTYSAEAEMLIVMDNSETPSSEFADHLKGKSNCTYVWDGENRGISSRLTMACDMARAAGLEWLLTMDQDSSFKPGVLESYIEKCDRNMASDIAIFALNYLPELWKVEDRAIPVVSTITSGSLVSLTVQKKIGPYSEALFIDLVDAEYCYRCINNGYRILSLRDVVLEHRIGYIQYGRSLKTFRLTPRVLHNPIRIYYIVRNAFFMLHRYPSLPHEARKEIRQCLSLLKNNILYHKKRGAVLRYIVRGYLDFKRGRMGKLIA